jgi:hypothetical protein
MSSTLSNASPDRLQALIDRQAIVDVLLWYCRGVDRNDRSALERVYWPDSFDDHVHLKLPGPQYVDHVLKATAQMRTSHHLGNILIEFDGPGRARCESYFLGLHEMAGEDGALVFMEIAGRYLDVFEKRGEDWRILERTLVYDFVQRRPAQDFDTPWLARINRRGAAFPDDPVYTALKPRD